MPRRSYEIPDSEWAQFSPGDACPCCLAVLVAAPRLNDASPQRALCVNCTQAGLTDLITETN